MAINALSDEPRPAGVRRLFGSTDLWRLRVGDYRVVYTIRHNELLVVVLRVAHRSEVYRDLWTPGKALREGLARWPW